VSVVLEKVTSFTYLSTWSFVPFSLSWFWIQITAISQNAHDRSFPGDDTFLFSFSTTVSIPELHRIGFDYQLDVLFGWNTNCSNIWSLPFKLNWNENQGTFVGKFPEYLPSQAINFHALFSHDKPSMKLLY
jgi:hypothetical protein